MKQTKPATPVEPSIDTNSFFRHGEKILRAADAAVPAPERLRSIDDNLTNIQVFGAKVELRSDMASYEEHLQYAKSLLRNTIKAGNVERSVRDALERANASLFRIMIKQIELKNKPPRAEDY